MKKCLIFLFSILTFASFSQTNLPLFKDGKINENVFGAMRMSPIDTIQVNVPINNIVLNLTRNDILADFFIVTDENGVVLDSPNGTFYKGSIQGDPISTGTVSIIGDEVVCSFSNHEGNYEITGEKGQAYSLKQTPDLTQFDCQSLETPRKLKQETANSSGSKVVEIYFEVDNQMYRDLGSSTSAVTNYVISLFNQIATLYSNEEIQVKISQIKIWTTLDPYNSLTNTGSILTQFRNTLRSNFNGNLAHFLTTRQIGGGIAYVDVLCFKEYAFGVSYVQTSFSNVPTYSWSVEVVTHELGHNIGSWHTQSCNWPGGALDNCYPPEGNCSAGPTPINGGTIMSYCHLTSHGINFAHGFGSIPGNYIRQKYNNSSCLPSSGSSPTNLQTSEITNTTAKLNWSLISGTQSYTIQYKQTTTTTWNSIVISTNNYLLSNLVKNTQYQWKVKTDCSDFSSVSTFTTTNQGSACNVSLLPSFTNITLNSCVVFWNPVEGETLYNLQYKEANALNWIEYGLIPGTTLTLKNLLPNTSYMVRVRPNCNPAFGQIRQFKTLEEKCKIPTGLKISNKTSSSATISWDSQTNSTYYVGIRLHNQTNWFSFGPLTLNSLDLSGLLPGSGYDFKIKTNCSDWSDFCTFVTLKQLPQMKTSSKSLQSVKVKN